MTNLNNKKFQLLENAKSGEVSGDTTFLFSQEGNIIEAKYHGGSITKGQILGLLDNSNHTIAMSYHCVTDQNEIKVGKALANISYDTSKRIHLKLDWEWVSGAEGKGSSHYVESDQ
ncbi:MAG: n-acetylglutamate synthase [Cyclobacteriaceae bacterium]